MILHALGLFLIGVIPVSGFVVYFTYKMDLDSIQNLLYVVMKILISLVLLLMVVFLVSLGIHLITL